MIVKLTEKYIGKKYSIHSLRHSSALRNANNGASINEISSFLGHASYGTTSIYLKQSKTMTKNMFERSNPK